MSAYTCNNRFVLLLLSSVFCCAVYAEQDEVSSYQLVAGFGVERMSYHEYDQRGRELDREVGWMKSLSVSVAGPVTQAVSWRVGFHRSYDSLQYIGESQSGVPSRTTTDENFRSYEVGAFTHADGYIPALLLSAGKTDWQRMIRANNITGALDEYYQWLFVSAGLGYDVVFIDRLLQVKGGYRLLFNGELEVDFTDYGYGKADVDLADGHEWWLSAEYPLLSWRSSELSLSYRFRNGWAAASERGSAGTLSFYEPESRTQSHRYLLQWGTDF